MVSITTGVSTPLARNCFKVSMPVMPGILMSSRMMSADSSRARRTPSSPELTAATTWTPRLCSNSSMPLRTSAWSSISSTRMSASRRNDGSGGRRRVEDQHDTCALPGLALDHDLTRQPLGAFPHDRKARMLARHALGDASHAMAVVFDQHGVEIILVVEHD